jgi:hypothetical protein
VKQYYIDRSQPEPNLWIAPKEQPSIRFFLKVTISIYNNLNL